MKLLTCFCLGLLTGFCVSVHAKDLAAYQVGDTADADIVTPVALDVTDVAATTNLQTAKAREYPAIFRSFPEATNAMVADFMAAFDQSRTRFLTEVTNEFHRGNLHETNLESADFSRLITAFGVENKDFPATDELAASWAQGQSGEDIRDQWLTALLRAAQGPVRPDDLPPGMFMGKFVRLVPVTDPDQKLAFETVLQGELVPADTLTPLTDARQLFRHEFTSSQQIVARALSNFLKPTCFPDAPYTQLIRGSEVYQMVVADHFEAGDAIVRQGQTIDQKIKAALVALKEKMAATASTSPTPPPLATNPLPSSAAAPATNVGSKPLPTPPQPPGTSKKAPPGTNQPVSHSGSTSGPASPSKPVALAQKPVYSPSKPFSGAQQQVGLILILVTGATGALLVAGWQLWKERRQSLRHAAIHVTKPQPAPDASSLSPLVSQVLREQVQQELVQQRGDLLVTQQSATQDIASLVQRLDELHMPMQERLQTYQIRIQTLEKELALRNEENRELLKIKLEMFRQQMESERAASQSNPSAPK